MILWEAPEATIFRAVFDLEEPDMNTLSKSNNNFFPSFSLKVTY